MQTGRKRERDVTRYGFRVRNIRVTSISMLDMSLFMHNLSIKRIKMKVRGIDIFGYVSPRNIEEPQLQDATKSKSLIKFVLF